MQANSNQYEVAWYAMVNQERKAVDSFLELVGKVDMSTGSHGEAMAAVA